MSVVGRLKQGDMIVGSEIDERLPSITDGLVAHFPFDDTEKGIRYKNILDYSTWFAGDTGASPGFTTNGSVSENGRVLGVDPWGKQTVLWEAKPEGDRAADGGWNSSYFSIDTTKTYRFSTWVKRTVLGDGTAYLGLNAAGGSTALVYTNAATTSTNPYFWSGSLPENEWVLIVGHVHPHDYSGGNHPDSGRYTLDERIGGISRDFKWSRESTTARHRSYLYYSTGTNTRQHWCYPRVDVCDGSEPTLQDLLMGEGNVYNTNPTETSRSQLGIGVGAATTNLLRNGISPYASYHDFEQLGHGYKFTMKGANRFIVFSINNAGAMKGMTFSASGIMKQNGRPIGLAGDRMNTYNSVSDNKMYYSDPKTGEFKITETMGGSSSYMFHMPTRSVDGDIITIDEFQIELGDYSTPFVENSRSGGRLDIPFNLKPPYTINFWHKGLKLLSTVTSQAESPMLLQFNNYASSPSISIWNINKNLRIYGRGNTTAAWTTNTAHKLYTASEWDNEWHMYTFVAENTTRFRIYVDGKLAGTQTSSESITNLTYLSMGNSYQPNAIYKEMSLYDKRLTDEEIGKLYQPSMNIQKDGVMKTEIQEGIPVGDNSPHWLSLGDSTISEDERMTPIVDNNAVFEDGALWAGNATKNIYNLNVSGNNWPSANSNMAKLTTITSPHSFEVKGTSDVPGAYSYVYPNYTANNVIHSFQATITNNNSRPVQCTVQMRDGSNGSSLTTTSTFSVEEGETRKVKLDGTKAVSSGRITACVSIYSDSVDGTVDATVHDIQLEEGAFCSPYTESSRGQTRLSYPPVISGKPFSLSMWVKQIAADNVYNMPFDAYASQLYVAMRSNMSLHFSFTNNGSQASLLSPTGATTLNKWHHIGAIKTASKLEMYLDGELINTYNATGTGFTMTCSDIHIGSYNTSYPFNGYIRDVIIDVDNKYLSKEKMKEIYETQMRSFKNNETTVSGQIIEGGGI